MKRNIDIHKRLLAHLTALAEADLQCPSNVDLAVALRTGRSTIVRALDLLDNEGRIERRGAGIRRRVTIVALGVTTAKRRIPHDLRSRRIRASPPCAVCGDPVVEKSGKFPRSCAKTSCRVAVRSLAYGGTIDDIPWPILTGEINEIDFSGQDLYFSPDVRRSAGLPFTRSYGISTVYED